MTNASHAIEVGGPRASWPSSSDGRWFALLGIKIGDAFRRWQTRRTQLQVIRDLRSLDDRMLKDIGLHRSQIVSAVVTGARAGS